MKPWLFSISFDTTTMYAIRWKTKMQFENCIRFHVGGYSFFSFFFKLVSVHLSFLLIVVCGSIVATIYPLRHTHLLVDDCANTRNENLFFVSTVYSNRFETTTMAHNVIYIFFGVAKKPVAVKGFYVFDTSLTLRLSTFASKLSCFSHFIFSI